MGSVGELAARYGLGRSYVGRILKLAGLAPDLVDDILAGREPGGLALRRLPKLLPILWRKQRQMLLGDETAPAV